MIFTHIYTHKKKSLCHCWCVLFKKNVQVKLCVETNNCKNGLLLSFTLVCAYFLLLAKYILSRYIPMCHTQTKKLLLLLQNFSILSQNIVNRKILCFPCQKCQKYWPRRCFEREKHPNVVKTSKIQWKTTKRTICINQNFFYINPKTGH